MKSDSSWRVRLAQTLFGLVIVIALIVARGTSAGDEPVHLATDWSHHHVVFSEPKTMWEHILLLSNPRYAQQLARRDSGDKGRDNSWWRWRRAPESDDTLQGDWSMKMNGINLPFTGTYPAKFSFNAGVANCVTPAPPAGQQPDFVAYSTSAVGATGAASLIAYANLYAGTCTPAASVPKVYWAYNTLGQIHGSIALSGDGSQVAFTQFVTSDGTAALTLLKWSSVGPGTATVPTTPTLVTNAGYRNCTAPCMTNLELGEGECACTSTITLSSPFYDFSQGSDTMYLGDDDGILHKYTGVFKGTPAEVMANGWPAQVSLGGELTSPVYVGVTATASVIYITDTTGALIRVSQTATAVTPVASASLGTAGMSDGPIVDPSTGKIYIFLPGNNGTPGASGTQRIQVVQFAAGFSAGSSGSSTATISSNGTLFDATNGVEFYIGTFDNLYYTSANGTGNMYVCGTNAGITSLYQIVVNTGTLASVSPTPTALSTTNSPCSPITEFNNGAVDRIFLGVNHSLASGSGVNCGTAAGCIMSFNVTSGTLPTTQAAHALATSGTSGIVVDGSSAITGASQVYYTPLGNQTCPTSTGSGVCAIQASQSGLN